MTAEILTIGTELLLGHSIDTNSAYIGEQLAETGIDVYWKTTVGDNEGRIREALGLALTPTPSRSRGMTCSLSIGRISEGTPGIATTSFPSPRRIKRPGAVPRGLGNTVAPSGIRACRSLFLDMASPRSANR